MSGFFKTNIYIYVYICMFCLVAGDDAENKEICVACEDKQWCFTLDMTNEFGNKFYSLLETKELFTIKAELYDNPFNAEIDFDPADINLSGNFPQNKKSFEAGDLVAYYTGSYCLMYILGEGITESSGLKVGELEKSFINDFKSFVEGKIISNEDSASFTFSKKPEPQLDTKIIVTSIILLLLLLPLLLLIYFKFK